MTDMGRHLSRAPSRSRVEGARRACRSPSETKTERNFSRRSCRGKGLVNTSRRRRDLAQGRPASGPCSLKAPRRWRRRPRVGGLSLEKEVPGRQEQRAVDQRRRERRHRPAPAGGTIFAGSDLQAPVTVPNGTAYSSLTLGPAEGGRSAAGGEHRVRLRGRHRAALRLLPSLRRRRPAGTGRRRGPDDAVGGGVPWRRRRPARLPVGAFVSLRGRRRAVVQRGGVTRLDDEPSGDAWPADGRQRALVQAAPRTIGPSGRPAVSSSCASRSRPRPTLRLAFYRRRGRSLTVSAKAQRRRLGSTFKGKDLLATLMRRSARTRKPTCLRW